MSRRPSSASRAQRRDDDCGFGLVNRFMVVLRVLAYPRDYDGSAKHGPALPRTGHRGAAAGRNYRFVGSGSTGGGASRSAAASRWTAWAVSQLSTPPALRSCTVAI